MKHVLPVLIALFLLACDDLGVGGSSSEGTISETAQEIREATAAEHADDLPVPTEAATTPPGSIIITEKIAYGEVQASPDVSVFD